MHVRAARGCSWLNLHQGHAHVRCTSNHVASLDLQLRKQLEALVGEKVRLGRSAEEAQKAARAAEARAEELQQQVR